MMYGDKVGGGWAKLHLPCPAVRVSSDHGSGGPAAHRGGQGGPGGTKSTFSSLQSAARWQRLSRSFPATPGIRFTRLPRGSSFSFSPSRVCHTRPGGYWHLHSLTGSHNACRLSCERRQRTPKRSQPQGQRHPALPSRKSLRLIGIDFPKARNLQRRISRKLLDLRLVALLSYGR